MSSAVREAAQSGGGTRGDEEVGGGGWCQAESTPRGWDAGGDWGRERGAAVVLVPPVLRTAGVLQGEPHWDPNPEQG